MKQMLTKALAAVMALGLLFSCEPVEDREDLPATNLDPSEINISVTNVGNDVTMTNSTPDVIPYWSYKDAAGNELGHSNQNTVNTVFPFAGTYTVDFTAYTRGGAVQAASKTLIIASNDSEYFSAPEWSNLTNGVAGKTWVLDMSGPIGWAGFDYPYNPNGDDYWNWFPDYAGNEWVMPNKDWGEMTFNLDGGYNVSVTQTALITDDQTTKTGNFSYDIASHSMMFNGAEMLFGGDYYPDVSNWSSLKVVELTPTSLRLSVVRDQARNPNDGPCQIVYHFKPKE
ncbi:hypothetical protein FMM05_04755 [Flavobacterium zepuense]|uniref:PKD domain-containing protein n=1 Tax=Flavobacterium zepuense TaxID=2593302 RepID=A0A552V897_9FLAO|nr:hypothetical protein [Flavobacterium zepuense]TRW26691.1 hypothetical protein FMM05_04755 [Flavobacterium zepuense]